MPQITIDYQSQLPSANSEFQICVKDRRGERILSSDGADIVVDVDTPFTIKDLGAQPLAPAPDRDGWRSHQ